MGVYPLSEYNAVFIDDVQQVRRSHDMGPGELHPVEKAWCPIVPVVVFPPPVEHLKVNDGEKSDLRQVECDEDAFVSEQRPDAHRGIHR